jgi:hypothetical protein
MTDKQYRSFVSKAKAFFLDENGRLFKQAPDAQYRLVVFKPYRIYILKTAHDSLGHQGGYVTKELIGRRFWWPEFDRDIYYYVKTCHLYQRKTESAPAHSTYYYSYLQSISSVACRCFAHDSSF